MRSLRLMMALRSETVHKTVLVVSVRLLPRNMACMCGYTAMVL